MFIEVCPLWRKKKKKYHLSHIKNFFFFYCSSFVKRFYASVSTWFLEYVKLKLAMQKQLYPQVGRL